MRNLKGMFLIFVTVVLHVSVSAGQDLDGVAYEYARKSLPQLVELLSLANDAHDRDSIYKNIEWCEKAFQTRKFTTRRFETPTLPLLLAERSGAQASKTVLIYLQLDGQPVDPQKWDQESPWKPVLKKRSEQERWIEIPWSDIQNKYDPEYRIFARSASDAKGPVGMFLAALDAVGELEVSPTYNIKVIMDFEEEMGSPSLASTVEEYRGELAADALIIFDGPRHISNQPTLNYGARGIATVSIEVFGPRTPLHSGHYGNYAPNPALRLSRLLCSMKDDGGRVTIPGWYDGVELTDETKRILKQVPDDEGEIRKKLGIASIDRVATNYQESIQYPSLNILGLRSGWVDEQRRTIVPASAVAEMDIRLVRESDPERLIRLLKEHISEQGFHFVNGLPTEEERLRHPKLVRIDSNISYRAFRTDFDTAVGHWLRSAMKKAFGSDPIQIRTAGGSIPISFFVNTLGVPAVIVPTVNPDNNQHGPNENIRLGNYVDGVKTMIAILSEGF